MRSLLEPLNFGPASRRPQPTPFSSRWLTDSWSLPVQPSFETSIVIRCFGGAAPGCSVVADVSVIFGSLGLVSAPARGSAGRRAGAEIGGGLLGGGTGRLRVERPRADLVHQ